MMAQLYSLTLELLEGIFNHMVHENHDCVQVRFAELILTYL